MINFIDNQGDYGTVPIKFVRNKIMLKGPSNPLKIKNNQKKKRFLFPMHLPKTEQ